MNIGLIAHDAKKVLMQNFCIAYRGILCKHELYATGTTGRLIEEVANLNVHKFLAGHLGGEHVVYAYVGNGVTDGAFADRYGRDDDAAVIGLRSQTTLHRLWQLLLYNRAPLYSHIYGLFPKSQLYLLSYSLHAYL